MMPGSGEEVVAVAVVAVGGALAAWLHHASQLVVIVLLWPLLFIYPMIVGLLAISVPQRILLFLHHVNYPFFVDWDKPEVYGFSPNKARNLTITAADGVKIGAWHILPSAYYRKKSEELDKRAASPTRRKGSLVDGTIQNRALKERPVFLYFHGNAGNRASPKRIETYRNLSERLNVNVLTIDYRGFGNSEGSPTENGLALDARAAWNWLLAEGVDAKNIILLGHSLGTGVAARLARDLSNDSPVSMQPRGIILQAPYASIPDVAFEFRVFQAIPLLYPIQFFPSLENFLRASILDRFDTLSHIPHLTNCPILLIHGALDREIPYLHSRMLFAAAMSAHCSDSELNRREIVEITRQYLKDAYMDETSVIISRRNNTTQSSAALKIMSVFKDCKESDEGWKYEGRRWSSVQNNTLSGSVSGPPKIMLLELIHAHHNNVQSHDLVYDSIESFLTLS